MMRQEIRRSKVDAVDTCNVEESPDGNLVEDLSQISIKNEDFDEVQQQSRKSSGTKFNIEEVSKTNIDITLTNGFRKSTGPLLQEEELILAKEHGVSTNVVDKLFETEVKAAISNNLQPSSTKHTRRPVALFNDLQAATKEALTTFLENKETIYQYDWIGDSPQDDSMACECKPSIGENGINVACGSTSDCINRTLSMECSDEECSCGEGCRNQRFQRCEYADIDVIKTEQKGFGIRANSDLLKDTFVYEYIGEAIEEQMFRKRMREYDEDGIKHFYFMMIQPGEYIDATKKGGLARFLNHSCFPNCYVDKWVVGTKLRMGIFTKRRIQAGEELTFDYNVDRYGANAQPCYCGEPNCIGYIGGRTQTEAQPKLSKNVMEALGLEENEDWGTVTAASRRRRKSRKANDDDEDDEYIGTPTAPILTAGGVGKIMSTLLQTKEQWVIVKLLSRIESSSDEDVPYRILRMHGYQILGTVLKDWKADNNILVTILKILLKLPRASKNKIESSGIEGSVKDLTSENENDRVKELATELLKEWSTLKMEFRIARKIKSSIAESVDITLSPPTDGQKSASNPVTPANVTTPKPSLQNTLHRQMSYRSHRNNFSRSNSIVASDPSNDAAFRSAVPTGPRISIPPKPSLPSGWNSARDPTGTLYYYNREGHTQWEHPADSRAPPPPPPPPPTSLAHNKKTDLETIIKEASKQIAEKAALQRAEEEKQREAREREEAAAAKARAKEKAEMRRSRENGKPRKDNPKERNHDPSHRSHETHGSNSVPKSKEYKHIEKQFGRYVPNWIAGHYKSLSRDDVKKYSRDVVHILMGKELRPGREVKLKDELSEDKKKKIKIFVKGYMDKVIARKAQRTAERDTIIPPKAIEPSHNSAGPPHGPDATQKGIIMSEHLSTNSPNRVMTSRSPSQSPFRSRSPSNSPRYAQMSPEEHASPVLRKQNEEEEINSPRKRSINEVEGVEDGWRSIPPPPPPPPGINGNENEEAVAKIVQAV